MQSAHFTCPHCRAKKKVSITDDHFYCPDCSRRFETVLSGSAISGCTDLGEDFSWSSRAIYPLSKISDSPLREIQSEPEPAVGAARARQLKRQQRGRTFDPIGWLVGVLGLLLACLLVLPAIPRSADVSAHIESEQPSAQQFSSGTAASGPAHITVSTATATPTPTSLYQQTPTTTAMPTPTRLPSQQLTATAWGLEVESALSTSSAVQTENATRLSTTQTALPPTVYANMTQSALNYAAATATRDAILSIPTATERPGPRQKERPRRGN